MSTVATVFLVIAAVIVGVILAAITGCVGWLRGKLGMTQASGTTTNSFGRDDVAKKVITYAGVGIILTAVVIIVAPIFSSWLGDKPLEPNALSDVSKTVFNTLVPMFGTWVGTVIAFYFARENYESAAKATKDLVGQLGDDRLKQIQVKDAWIPTAAIDAITVEAGQENTIPFAEVRKKLSSKVSRVPIWNANKQVRFVIHESMIFRFIALRAEARNEAVNTAVAANQAPPAAAAADTLATFLSFQINGTTFQNIVSKVGWVAQTATLADAKAKMEGTPDCQDVFVTNSGAATEPVLGWITNADLARSAKA